MRDEYDFTESIPNPYAEPVRKAVTLKIDLRAIDWFKAEAARTGVPYQTLMNSYLLQCAEERRSFKFV